MHHGSASTAVKRRMEDWGSGVRLGFFGVHSSALPVAYRKDTRGKG